MFPFIIEAGEYFAEHSYENYWNYLNELGNINVTSIVPCSKGDYQTAIELANKVAPHLLSNLKLALSLHERLPKTEFYQNVAIDRRIPFGCENTFTVNNKILCGYEKLEEELKNVGSNNQRIEKWDRLYNNTRVPTGAPLVYYYQDIMHPDFIKYHRLLISLVGKKKIQYVFFSISKKRCEEKAKLSGFGASLNIKNMAYKASDDQEINLFSQQIPDTLKFYQSANSSVNFDAQSIKDNLDRKELFYFMINASASTDQAERLSKLRTISCNLPSYYEDFVNFPKSRSHLSKMYNFFRNNPWMDNYGDTSLFVGHRELPDDISVFELVSVFSKQFTLFNDLQRLGFNHQEVLKIFNSDVKKEKLEIKLNVKSDYILWLNDIEHDLRYQDMNPDIYQINQQLFYDPFYFIRRNLFNLVFFLDPSASSFLPSVQFLHRLIVNSVPIHFGIVLVPNMDSHPTKVFSRAFSKLIHDSKRASAIKFLFSVLQDSNELEIDNILGIYRQIDYKDALVVSGGAHEMDQFLHESIKFYHQLGLREIPTAVFNGDIISSKQLSENSGYTIINMYRKLATEVREYVRTQNIAPSDDVSEIFMSGPKYLKKIHMDIINYQSGLLSLFHIKQNDCRLSSDESSESLFYCLLKSPLYLNNPTGATQTFWLILNAESVEGKTLLNSYLQSDLLRTTRAGILFSHVPDGEAATSTDLLFDALSSLNAQELPGSDFDAVISGRSLSKAKLKEIRTKLNQQLIFNELFQVYDTGSYVIQDNKKYGPINDEYQFTSQDFQLASKLHDINSVQRILNSDPESTLSDSFVSVAQQVGLSLLDVMDIVHNIISSVENVKTGSLPPLHEDGFEEFVIKIKPMNDTALYAQIFATLNPVIESGRKLVSILDEISRSINCEITIVLVPDSAHDQAISTIHKQFYRFNIKNEFVFKGDSVEPHFNLILFDSVPQDSVLTFYSDTHQSWFIESMFSNCDMDNIYLETTAMGCIGVYDLEYIMIEGHAFDTKKGTPASGVQLVLQTLSQPDISDTLVIHNLGYFQFKASAGAYFLDLKKGASSDGHSIELVTSLKTGGVGVITVDSFIGQLIRVEIGSRESKSDKSNEESTPKAESSFFGSFSKYIFGEKTLDQHSEEKNQTESRINIFTLATGLLYERFTRIMVLSVLENTKTPVKFWFLKNYVSPQFKISIDLLSKKLNFEYEFVQYQWPHWLLKQKDKQRIIWGYKILFLDVLFPLDVKRIIFVDADQIVRADLNELYTMDLGNAPYAYTPFCDDRPEMERFRFWKSGYWRTHLAGKPYHISALYVVDLVKFRQMMAGDRLRSQYQALTNDPNSLANLDQDLPNNLQHVVPIKSLPIEWLWCETWCSDKSKKYAKTIDMCNNPLTHEAKLDRAKRIAPEWVKYDHQINLYLDQPTTTNTIPQKESKTEL